jgi:acetolactate synthase-1/2/3 large subunit
MAEMTGAELLVRCLHAERVRFVHAITDGTYMMVMEALERLGDELGIRLVVPRHEAAGAHAADAQTRVTGEPAVVMACAGPGAANLLSGLVNAQAEGSPVVAITTCRRAEISDAYGFLGASQSPDHLALFRAAVKWNAKVEHWKRIPDVVRHAFRVATSGSPGPTHVLVPEDVLNQRGEVDEVSIWPRERYRLCEPRPAPEAAVRRAAEILVEAPVVNVHAGNGAQRAGAGAELRTLAEHLAAPVTLGIAARGLSSRRCVPRASRPTRRRTRCSRWVRGSASSPCGAGHRSGAIPSASRRCRSRRIPPGSASTVRWTWPWSAMRRSCSGSSSRP